MKAFFSQFVGGGVYRFQGGALVRLGGVYFRMGNALFSLEIIDFTVHDERNIGLEGSRDPLGSLKPNQFYFAGRILEIRDQSALPARTHGFPSGYFSFDLHLAAKCGQPSHCGKTTFIHIAEGIVLEHLAHGTNPKLVRKDCGAIRSNTVGIYNRALGCAHRCKSKYLFSVVYAEPERKYLQNTHTHDRFIADRWPLRVSGVVAL